VEEAGEAGMDEEEGGHFYVGSSMQGIDAP